MGKVGKMSIAGKNHGPCDVCDTDILPGQRYLHVFREATLEERRGSTSQRKRTYTRSTSGRIDVLVKKHSVCMIGRK